MQIILEEEEKRKRHYGKDLVQWDEQYLPVIDVRIENYATLKRLQCRVSLYVMLSRWVTSLQCRPTKCPVAAAATGTDLESLVENADYIAASHRDVKSSHGIIRIIRSQRMDEINRCRGKGIRH